MQIIPSLPSLSTNMAQRASRSLRFHAINLVDKNREHMRRFSSLPISLIMLMKSLTFFEKGDVNGANARQLFSFLKQKLPNEDGTHDIRWNFNIFLVDQEGDPTQRFQPSKTPYDELKPNIEELLKKAEK
mmetsp:Transcript_22957/g.41665  ORF Transcript_22957/g.41665 Transcript_22957/m.41665 type:complete len:130 (-) Transcript_22957:970-1359(-)